MNQYATDTDREEHARFVRMDDQGDTVSGRIIHRARNVWNHAPIRVSMPIARGAVWYDGQQFTARS